MRTALLCGSIVAAGYFILHLPRVLSNADFIYMCVGAANIADHHLPASPYFPPGYPALLWMLVSCRMTALTAGVVLSALGSGLTAGAVAYCARLWRVPPAPALCFGLLTATLPSVFIIGLNPHLDALYTGLGAVLLAGAMRALTGRPGAWTYIAALLCAVLLLSLRYHAVLLVFPLALVLLFSRKPGVRPLGTALLLTALLASAGVYYALFRATGSLHTASLTQVQVGAAYRAAGSEDAAVSAIYDDYPKWLANAPPVTAAMVLDAVRANWPQFLLRKAILAGVVLWLLGLAIQRRQAPGAHWLALFILGYTLAVSPTYFTERASALPEVAGLLLAVGGIAVLLFPEAEKSRRRRRKPMFKLDPAIGGTVLAGVALLACAYDGWRELPILGKQSIDADDLRAINAGPDAALDSVGHKLSQLYGRMDFTGIYGSGQYNLPGSTWSRLWMDDPTVAPQVRSYIHKYSPEDVVECRTEVTSVMILKNNRFPAGDRLFDEIYPNHSWMIYPLTHGVTLFKRVANSPRKDKKGGQVPKHPTARNREPGPPTLR